MHAGQGSHRLRVEDSEAAEYIKWGIGLCLYRSILYSGSPCRDADIGVPRYAPW